MSAAEFLPPKALKHLASALEQITKVEHESGIRIGPHMPVPIECRELASGEVLATVEAVWHENYGFVLAVPSS